MWLDSQDGHEGASDRVPGKQKYSQFSSFTSGKHCTTQQYMWGEQNGKGGLKCQLGFETIRVHKPYWPRWQVTTDTVCPVRKLQDGPAGRKQQSEGYPGTKALLLSLKVDTAFTLGVNCSPTCAFN